METKRKLGAHIASLRRKKGMTQEQLASALGVSAPAVSKWETDASCPDITLLCPLARALGTNVDTLLQFEETLTQEQLSGYFTEIMEDVRTQGGRNGEKMLQELLHRYPSSMQLKLYGAAALTMMEIWLPTASPEQKEMWKSQRRQLLEQMYKDGAGTYREFAVSQLAAIEMREGKLDLAEELLNEIPDEKPEVDLTVLRSLLYQKQEQPDKAREIVQKRLFALLGQMQTCLIQLMSAALTPKPEEALEICEIYLRLQELFGSGSGMDAGLLAEIYLRAGQPDKALEHILQMVDAVCDTVRPPHPLLFSAMRKDKGGQSSVTMPKEIRKMLLNGLQDEELYERFREDARFREAVEKLQASIGE